MFGHNEVIGSSQAFDPNKLEVGHGSTLTDVNHHDHTFVAIQRASPHRLAELVHHLSDVPVREARRAVRLTGNTCDDGDPLSIVAAALIQLRREAHRCVGA